MVNQGLNLSLNELRLIAKYRNISDYENKSAKDLIKALTMSRPRLGIKKNKLKEIKEDFYNLRQKFSKKDADKYIKLFYDIKNYRHLSEVEIENFNKLEKILKSLVIILILLIMKILIMIKSLMWKMLMVINIEKSVRRLFEESNRDYYKPRVADRSFAG